MPAFRVDLLSLEMEGYLSRYLMIILITCTTGIKTENFLKKICLKDRQEVDLRSNVG